MLEKLKKAKPIELEIWMLSAIVAAFGLGAYLASYTGEYSIWIFTIGIIMHLFYMYKIYSR